MTPLLAQGLRSERAFERMYQRHVGDIYRYALAVLRNPADAEDVTQTTFLNAYRAFERGEVPRSPQNWLISIAHNVCRQRFRQSARRPQEVTYDDAVASQVEEDEAGPSAEDIQRALGHLAFNQRAALVMRELEGRSYTEIAEILGVSVSAVETLLFRARRSLREQLEGSLTCHEAELAISKQADGRLPRGERGALRAHLRECRDCERFARSQRAQRTAFKALGAIPVPASLSSFFGGGVAVGAGVGAKAAAVVAAGVVVAGAGYEGVKRTPLVEERDASAPASVQRSSDATAARERRVVGPEPSSPAVAASVDVAKPRKRGNRQAAGTAPPGQRATPAHAGRPAKAKVNGKVRASAQAKARGKATGRPAPRATPPQRARARARAALQRLQRVQRLKRVRTTPQPPSPGRTVTARDHPRPPIVVPPPKKKN